MLKSLGLIDIDHSVVKSNNGLGEGMSILSIVVMCTCLSFKIQMNYISEGSDQSYVSIYIYQHICRLDTNLPATDVESTMLIFVASNAFG